MLEVLKSIAPMFLAAVFSFTAAHFAGAGIKKKSDRKIAFAGAFLIEAVSFSIWLPCLNDLFNVFGLTATAKQTAMIISVATILIATAIISVMTLKEKET